MKLETKESKQRVKRYALRPAEVAEAVGLSVDLIYREIHAGRLRTLKINNSYLISEAAIDAWLNPEETA